MGRAAGEKQREGGVRGDTQREQSRQRELHAETPRCRCALDPSGDWSRGGEHEETAGAAARQGQTAAGLVKPFLYAVWEVGGFEHRWDTRGPTSHPIPHLFLQTWHCGSLSSWEGIEK